MYCILRHFLKYGRFSLNFYLWCPLNSYMDVSLCFQSWVPVTSYMEIVTMFVLFVTSYMNYVCPFCDNLPGVFLRRIPCLNENGAELTNNNMICYKHRQKCIIWVSLFHCVSVSAGMCVIRSINHSTV